MINRKKTFRILLIAVIVLIVIAFVGKRLGWFGNSIEYEITTDKASKRSIVEIITANGKIQPETEVKISSDVSGEIVELNVKEGDEVKKGDLLLKIKPDTYISSLERMEASLNSAKANLANSKARLAQVEAQLTQTELTYNRNKKLFEQGAISQADYDNALAAYNMGKADVEAAKQTVVGADFNVKSGDASLKEANENLTKTSIYAPMSGTVSKLSVEYGERVVGTMQMTGTELLRIANLNIMEVKVNVNENDIVHVSMFDTSSIEIDAYPDQKFKGIVTSIANSSNTTGSTTGITTDQVTNFEVKIRILAESYLNLIPKDNPKFYPFRPGMSATVDIQTQIERNTLTVPIQSVTTRIDSSLNKTGFNKPKKENEEDVVKKADNDFKEYVFRFDSKSGTVEMVEIKTGIQDNNFIQILSGIKENDEVVSAPYSIISKKLKDKDRVKKVPAEMLFSGDK
ncbi:MAG: efflux RND transporter periplasmic adaptor subunit [Bacteroidia bacterium]|nr:efflux RND transporter periplasmic adaptor subunit [Bacteroidia bacterium]